MNPEKPKLFREQKKVVETKMKSLTTVPIQSNPRIYRSWINPAKSVRSPSDQGRKMKVVTSTVRNPSHEQAVFKSKEWKPGNIVYLYENSKDFDKILNPLSLKDFNRFIYQRNPRSP